MARASTLTKLPLDRFAFHIGISPIHFNGVYLDTANICPSPLMQFPWQNHDATSREDIAREIHQAEDDLERWLGFPLLPTWYEEEVHQLDQHQRYGSHRYRLPQQTFRLNRGYLISGGTRLKTLVEAGVSITYTDLDSDGYDETATITTTVPVALTADACTVHLYYPGWDGDDRYEIRPLFSVDLSAITGLITAVFRREQAVKLTLTDDPINPNPIDGTDDANFLDEVDVYLTTNQPNSQLTLEWSDPGGFCGCSGLGCSACLTHTQTACLVSRDKRLGLATYSPATWNVTDSVWTPAALSCSMPHPPTRVLANYRAGWEYSAPSSAVGCQLTQMDPQWERLVTILAVSRLDRRFCSCDTLEAYSQHWRKDYIGMEEGQFTNSEAAKVALGCPLGTTVGAVHVWKAIQQMITAGGGELARV